MNLDETLDIFRAVAEETRLRIVALLSLGELTVTEITLILGQSQPRISRHLKILVDSGLADRHREGSWMFYRICGSIRDNHVLRMVMQTVDVMLDSGDRIMIRDRERFRQSRETRAVVAAEYFKKNAGKWNLQRKHYLPESEIETSLVSMTGRKKVDTFVDLGAGTGRMLEVFADYYRSGIGYDLSREMLAIARASLEKKGITHAQVRHGDLFSLPLDSCSVDLVCLHQVLHFLAAPDAAIKEAVRILKPGGRILVSDFAPHDLEVLRDEHAHRRLGFSDEEVGEWCMDSGLRLDKVRTLVPGPEPDRRLTVKIWLCTLVSP